MPKIAKNLPYNLLTWMIFLQNCEVYLNEERLPINYHNFHNKFWLDLKVNPQIDKDTNP